MSDNLKPCPFCGGEATLVEDIYADKLYYYVTCATNNCDANTGRCDTEDEAITKWNNRRNPWHTGTPTEEGWYLLKVKSDDEIIYDTNRLIQCLWGLDWKYVHEEILAWQKIEED